MKHFILIDDELKRQAKKQLEADLAKETCEFTKGCIVAAYQTRMESENFICYLNGEFILIEYCDKILPRGFDSFPDFALKFIRAINKNMNKKTRKILYSSFSKSNELRYICDQKMKNEASRNLIFSSAYKEVNLIYCDNAGKEYAIVNDIIFSDLLGDHAMTFEKYEKAKEYLKSVYLEDRISEIEELYRSNTVISMSNAKILTSSNQLINNIKTEVK